MRGQRLKESAVRVEKIYIDKPKLSIRDKTSLNRLIYPSEVPLKLGDQSLYKLINGNIVPGTTYLIQVQVDSEAGTESEQWRLADH